jgi:hypothetical protein
MRQFTFLPLVLTLIAGCLAAQVRDERAWSNLKQIKEGQKVRIVTMDLKSVQGGFLSYSEQAIRVRTEEDKEIAVPRGDVFRVTGLYKTRRAKRILIGMGIGAGVGAAAGGIADLRRHAETGEALWLTELGLTIGAGAGAGIGAAMPAHPTVYRAERAAKP